MKRGSIALAIKRLTAEDHVRAEAAVARAEPFADRERYVAYLEKLHAFYAAIEPGLFARTGLPDERRKLPRLARDLDVLGGARRTDALRVPRIASCAEAYGVAYVLEGKTLGSRFLLAEAEARLGLDETTGASFLAGYGARTGAMWRTYLAALEAFVAAEGRRSTLVRAARATFRSFIDAIGASR